MSTGSGRALLVIERLAAEGLRIGRFTVRAHEAWCLTGGNASGIERLCDVLAGETTGIHATRLQLPPTLGLLSFKQQQSIFEAEVRKDDTDYLNRIDPGTPARDFLTDIERHRDLIDLFSLGHLLDRGYRQLSSGQARKLCLLQQITRGITLLVVENPYEGLDQASCRDLNEILAKLLDRGLSLLLLVGNIGDIPSWCTHLGAFKDGILAVQGPRAKVLGEIATLLSRQPPLFRVSVEELRTERRKDGSNGANNCLVCLRQGFARYGEVEVFSGLNLTIKQGSHTLITGPNGCGKSTLLQLIIGDHPLCYANDLTVFGRRRGSGESIWDLKKHMGIVSSELHRCHRVAGSALAIVLSGLFDSIGLYTQPTNVERQLARRWLHRLGLDGHADRPFRALSYGEQRLILLARALIKVPRLLILDEPTQGLDEANRRALLDFLGKIAAEELATILYVSHRPDEYRDFFRQQVRFT